MNTLRAVRDGLVIVTCVVFLVGAWQVHSAINRLQGIGGPPPAVECWDPGGGEVCAPGGEDGL